MGCSKNVSRCILICVNVLVLAAGAVLIGLGAWLRLSDVHRLEGEDMSKSGLSSSQEENFKRALQFAPLSMIIFGCFIFVVSFLGCFGAAKSNRCLLGGYFSVIFVILVAQLAVGGIALSQRNDFNSEVEKVVQNNFNMTESKDVFQAMCGDTAPPEALAKNKCYTNGPPCVKCVQDKLSQMILVAGAVLLSVCFLELLLLVASCCLIRAAQHGREEKRHLMEAGQKTGYYAA